MEDWLITLISSICSLIVGGGIGFSIKLIIDKRKNTGIINKSSGKTIVQKGKNNSANIK